MRSQQDQALEAFLDAVNLLEKDRGKLHEDTERSQFFEDKEVIYYFAILQLLQRKRYAEAFALMESSRARTMADLLESRSLTLGDPAAKNMYSQFIALKSQIADKQSLMMVTQNVTKLNSEISALERNLTQVKQNINNQAPKLAALLESKPVPLERVQRAMRQEGFEMLHYLVLEHATILWHISADGVHVRNVYLPRGQLKAKVSKLKQSLDNEQSNFDKQTASELYLYLIEPARQWIKSNRLVIVPHQDLHAIPFQVLLDTEGHYLGENFDISYAPSASVFMGLKPSAPLKNSKLYAVADPSFPDETKSIAALFPRRNQVLADMLAKESTVKSGVGNQDVVHISVHGTFVPSAPMLSYLKLSLGDGDDGKLTAAEMFGLPLENAKLVVLSACETGRSEVTNANEVLGMLRALLYAGANSLILSYWQVNADATKQWMEAFYHSAQTQTPVSAARQALLAVKKQPEFAHPYYWASFMTVAR